MSNPTICVKWTGQGDPDPIADFTVDFACAGCAGAPAVELKTGGDNVTWTLWSYDETQALDIGDIGEITIDATTATDDFDLKIEKAGALGGAKSVKSINLKDLTNWTGQSNINGGTILGDLTGDLTVVEDSGGGGGSVDLTVYGSVEGTLTIEKLGRLEVARVALGATINIETLTGAAGVTELTVVQDVAGTINITAFDGADPTPVEIHIGGDVTGTIAIETGVGNHSGPNDADPELQIDGDVSGTLSLGLPTSTLVSIGGPDNPKGGLSGTIRVTEQMKFVKIEVFGDVTSTGVLEIADLISLLPGPTGYYSGIVINKDHGAMAGDLILDNGIPFEQEVEILGLLTSTGSIDLKTKNVEGRLELEKGGSGSILNGGMITATIPGGGFSCFFVDCEVILGSTAGDTFSGQATFSSVASDGEIHAEGWDGSIKIVGDMEGTIDINGTLEGTGNVYITGNLTSTGSLSVGEDVEGDIDITGDHDGTIAVTGSLAGTGRILIDGLADGAIVIGQETVRTSLIRATEGLGTNGSITINDGAGNFNANGTIHIGPTAFFAPPPITFDGSIMIKKDASGPGGGVLFGAIAAC